MIKCSNSQFIFQAVSAFENVTVQIVLRLLNKPHLVRPTRFSMFMMMSVIASAIIRRHLRDSDRERMNGREMRNDRSNAVRFPAVAVTSSTVPSSSSTSTVVLGGGAAGLPPPPPPPIVYRGGDRFYPGGSIHHRPDHHQTGTAAPTLSHVPPPAMYPAYSHPHQPLPPIHNGPPSSITPPKTSTGQKKKNSTYHITIALCRILFVR